MGYAKYIGRVGGLAVALGVGMAVATTPGVAWADDTGSAGSGDTTGNGGRYYRHRWNDRIRNHHRNHDWSRAAPRPSGVRRRTALGARVWCGGRLQVRHLGVDGRVGAAGAVGDGAGHRWRGLVEQVEQRDRRQRVMWARSRP